MRLLTRTLTLLVGLALVLPLAAGARSRGTLAPPGNSAVSQYVEVVPNDAGASPPRVGGGTGGPLTQAQRGALAGLGAGGRTLAAVVDTTSPPPLRGATRRPAARRSARKAAIGAAETSRLLSAAGARSPASSVLAAAVGGGGGLGVLLPAIMLASAIGLAARAIWQRRRSS
jgi:hypothetical protein